MLSLVNLSALIAIILLSWFNTTMVIQYSKLFRLNKLFLTDEFAAAREKDPELHYGLFLYKEIPSFITKLLACYVCLSIWLSAGLSWACDVFGYFPVVNIMALGMYAGISWLTK